MTGVDSNGQRVLTFTGKIRNLGRIAELTDAIIDIAVSGAWRDYHTAIGHEAWRDAELDYFLIACGMRYDDVSRVLAYNKEAKALAPMMDKAAVSDRRPLEEAAKSWPSPTGETLLDRARNLGWVRDNGVVASPIPQRAAAVARHGVTFEEHARQERAKRIPAERRRELDAIAATVCGQVTDVQERRYLVERLTGGTVGRPTIGADPATWRADADRLNWNTKALAEHWGIALRSAQHRIKRLREDTD